MASKQWTGTGREASDLADIARLIERYPELRAQAPEDVLTRLV